MAGIAKRMRLLRELLDIRLGPGAAVLSPTVKRLHLRFARKMNEGHMGPRKFWRNMLPRLKYHNPAISMTIERTETQSDPATLTVFFAEPTTSAARPVPQAAATGSTSGDTKTSDSAAFDRTHVIDCKHKRDSYILEEVMRVAEGRQIEATAEEKELLVEMEEQRKRSDQDRVEMKAFMEKKRREEEMLRQARASFISAEPA